MKYLIQKKIWEKKNRNNFLYNGTATKIRQ